MSQYRYLFGNTRMIISSLTTLLENKGETYEGSAGNSTKEKKKFRELRGISFDITGWDDRSQMMSDNGLSVAFAETDFSDRLSVNPVNPGRAIELDTVGVLSKYRRSNGKLDYTYSERMCYQIEPIVKLLLEHPDTRQAFMSIWNPELDLPNVEILRVPCSIGFHFMIRDNKLYLVYYMRSLEVTKCLGNDIYTSTRLLETIASRLGIETGTVTFCVGSMHLFI